MEQAEKTSSNERIKMKKIFEPLANLFREKNLIFLCEGVYENSVPCRQVLLYSQDVTSFYSLNNKTFCLILETNKNTIKNFGRLGDHKFLDEEIKQTDCAYQNVVCKICNCVIGRFIISAPVEKEQLKNKILIFPEKVKSLLIDQFDTSLVNLYDFIQLKVKESVDINEICTINEKMTECSMDLLTNIRRTKEYLLLKPALQKTEKNLNILLKLVKYVNYLKSKNE